LTRAQILRQQLKADLQNARQNLRADRQKHGPFDPVKAAVRYSATLDRVTR
jgi:DnaJ-domain-containing protein 1